MDTQGSDNHFNPMSERVGREVVRMKARITKEYRQYRTNTMANRMDLHQLSQCRSPSSPLQPPEEVRHPTTPTNKPASGPVDHQ